MNKAYEVVVRKTTRVMARCLWQTLIVTVALGCAPIQVTAQQANPSPSPSPSPSPTATPCDCPPGWKCKPAPNPNATPLPPGWKPGENGVNRRVTATGPYGGVRGRITEPSFDLALDMSKPAVSGKDGQNPSSNKPTMYLGFTYTVPEWKDRNGKVITKAYDAVQVESGAQYEHFTYEGGVVPNGWSIFLRIHSNAKPKCEVWAQPRTRVAKGKLGSVGISFMINTDGTLSSSMGSTFRVNALEVNGSSPKKTNVPVDPFWPKDAQGRLNVGRLTVRRVIGMTQSKPMMLDGSWMENASFEGGEVMRISPDFKVNGKWEPWPVGTEAYPKDKTQDPAKIEAWPYVVDFGGDFKRLPPPAGDNGGHKSLTAPKKEADRYANEIVHLHMYGKPPEKDLKAKDVEKAKNETNQN